MAKYDIGGVVASLQLTDDGFSEGFKKAADNADKSGAKISSSLEGSARSTGKLGESTFRTANQIGEAAEKALKYTSVMGGLTASAKGLGSSFGTLGKGIAQFAGFGDFVEKGARVAEGLGGIGTSAIAAAGGVAIVGTALIGVAAIGAYAYYQIKKAQDETKASQERLLKVSSDFEAKLGDIGRLDKQIKTLGYSVDGVADSWTKASDSIKDYDDESKKVFADVSKYQAQQSSLSEINAQIKESTDLTKDLAEVRATSNPLERQYLTDQIRLRQTEAAAIEGVRKAQESVDQAKARAGLTQARTSTPELDAAIKLTTKATADLSRVKSDISEQVKGLFDISPSDLNVPKQMDAIIAKAEKIRDATAKTIDDNKDATNQEKIAAKAITDRQNIAIDRLKTIKGLQDLVADATKKRADAEKALFDANIAGGDARRDAVSQLEVATKRLDLAKITLDNTRAQNAIDASTKSGLSNITSEVIIQKTEVTKLGDAWANVKGRMLDVAALAGSTQQTSNRDLARRIQEQEGRRQRALERGPSGQGEAERAQANIDKLSGRIKTGETDESGRVITRGDRAASSSRINSANASMDQIQRDIEEAERQRKATSGASPEETKRRSDRAAKALEDAQRRGKALQDAGFGSDKLTKLLDRANDSQTKGFAMLKSVDDAIQKQIVPLLEGFGRMIGVTP